MMDQAFGAPRRRPDLPPTISAVPPSAPPSAEPKRVSRAPFFRTPLRKLLALVVAIAAVLGGVTAWQWWQDGPLRDAEAELARDNAPRALALTE